MKNFLICLVIFALSFSLIQWVSGLFLTTNYDAVAQNTGSSLQAAVTFGGVNILSLFIYILLAAILTIIIFFSVKSRRTN